MPQVHDKPRIRRTARRSDLKSALAAFDGPALLLDTHGRVVAANRAAAQALRASTAKLLGRSLFDLLPTPLGRPRRKAFRNVVRTGLPRQVQDSHDGRSFETSLLPALDAKGRTEHVVALTRDTTESTLKRAEAEQLAKEWQQTFDAITDIVALISPAYELIRVNRAGCQGIGKKLSELIGRKCYEVVHGLDRPIEGCPCARSLKTKRPGSGEFSSGGRHFIATADPILDRKGRLVAFTHTVKDITDRKQLEDELVRHQEHLAELVDERTRELKQAQDELLRQGRLATLGRVAGGLASELRGPLAAARSAAERLGQALTPAVGIEAARLVALIQRETDRSDRMAAAILHFVQRTRPRPARCSLRRILNQATTHAGLPANVSVHLELPPKLPRALADEQRMVVVFDNLLANAAQAMPDGGTIGVFATAQDRTLSVAVTDTGTGIAPEHMPRLFEPLFSTKKIGAGIGLAMCKTFVEADRGTIDVRSQPGKGTTFTVTLPAAP